MGEPRYNYREVHGTCQDCQTEFSYVKNGPEKTRRIRCDSCVEEDRRKRDRERGQRKREAEGLRKLNGIKPPSDIPRPEIAPTGHGEKI